MKWTDEMDYRLAELWLAKETATKIGKEFGVTRSAILGRVYRLGLPGHKSNFERVKAEVWRKKNPRASQKIRPTPVPTEPTDLPPEIRQHTKLIELHNLESSHCRWPVGSFYCGGPRVRGSYCLFHWRISVYGLQRRREEGRSKGREGRTTGPIVSWSGYPGHYGTAGRKGVDS